MTITMFGDAVEAKDEVKNHATRRTIQVLPESLVEKIAAGEIIERPASIVKELVENSLDAGATRVEIRLGDGGRKAITVTDDGFGIPAEELNLALRAHATSKISPEGDLTHIQTFGFRGEALSSIAAISCLDLLSRAEGSPNGFRVRSEGGTLRISEPYGMPPGTTVSAANLFFNAPARRKFLRSKGTELGHVETIVRKLAFTNVHCDFLLENDGEAVLHWPAADDLSERLRQMYGKSAFEKLIPFFGSDGTSNVEGFISAPALTFSRADEIWLMINGRPIRDRMIQSGIMEGYRSVLMERRYPMTILLLEVPMRDVDVNVHPTKAEVRFADSQPVFRLVSDSISRALRTYTRSSMHSRAELAEPGQGAPSPESRTASTPRFESLEQHMSASSWGDLQTSAPEFVTARTEALPYESNATKGPFASLVYLGTVDNTYLLLKDHQSLVIIDQHAAHERVHFERLKNAFEQKKPSSQRLLLPLTMEVSAQRHAAIGQLAELLARIGFEIEAFGNQTYVIKAVPETLGTHDPRPLLTDLADGVTQSETELAWNDHVQSILSRIACHSAVRAHDRLSSSEIVSLLGEMNQIDLATNCPHGRPTFLRFSVGDFERLFRRK